MPPILDGYRCKNAVASAVVNSTGRNLHTLVGAVATGRELLCYTHSGFFMLCRLADEAFICRMPRTLTQTLMHRERLV